MKQFFRTILLLGLLINSLCANTQDWNEYHKRGSEKYKSNDFKEAIEDYTKEIELHPNSMAYSLRGKAKYMLKDYIGAEADFTSSLSLYNGLYEALNYRVLTRIELKKYDSAMNDIAKIVSNKSWLNFYKPQRLYLNIGFTRYDNKSYAEAIFAFTKAIETDSMLIDAYRGRAQAKHKMNQTEAATKDFTKMIELAPNYFSYYTRGLFYHQVKKYDNAINDFTKSLELDKNYKLSYFARGQVYYDLKNFEKAIPDFNKLLELDPKHINGYLYRGDSKYATKDLNGAIMDFTKIIELKPDLADGYYYRAQSKIMNGDTNGGCLDGKKAKEMGSEFAEDLLNKNCK